MIVDMREKGYKLQQIAWIKLSLVLNVEVLWKICLKRDVLVYSQWGIASSSLIGTSRKTPQGKKHTTLNANTPHEVSKRTHHGRLYHGGCHRRIVKTEVCVKKVNRKQRLAEKSSIDVWMVIGRAIFSDNSTYMYDCQKMRRISQTGSAPVPRKNLLWFGDA